ncbi:Fe-S-cluster-containing hydrogenase subunit [Desulfosporosinus orientis DSM 765]|uniref:Fe-S-cluster-containing hydrogenase subunit n=1 Tax=Desulfosporosinus orientis (strain ATCC 19365 / DSM 765 / NCIMB 8382 / VKM B-1628 / Singapore I) TaxID=768706 RepID=G7WAC9_DESOD|nr:4Fe-4S dicluster domain-containing protein [Desulfosporosinus orientis]AET66478.1 Fe-S-cluster-containing hydrogenase subunit [Desulfosporosinus orientis DSM 765]
MSQNKRVTLSRRSLIKGGVLLGTVAAIGFMPVKILQAEEETVASNSEGKTSKQIGFCYDEGKCIRCQSCVRICQETYQWETENPWRRLLQNDKGDALSMSCNHCADPACAKVCPVKAYTKRKSDGIVVHDSNKCVGCGYCLYACPYHAPHIQKMTGAVSKCSFCYQLQDAGSSPKCVGICPTQALTMGDMKELSKKGNLNVKGLPDPKITNPSMVVIPKEQ